MRAYFHPLPYNSIYNKTCTANAYWHYSWTAISRGAVAKGLSNTIDDEVVTNVISRYSYGVAYAARFDPRIHVEEDRYTCPYMKIDKAKNQVQWYLRRVRRTLFQHQH